MLWAGIDLVILTFSFLSLAAFGVFLIARSERAQRFSLLVPLTMIAIWGIGMLVISGRFPLGPDLHLVAHAVGPRPAAAPARNGVTTAGRGDSEEA